MLKKQKNIDWEEEYKQLEYSHRCQLEEIEHEFRNKLDSERNTKNTIISTYFICNIDFIISL